MIKDRVCGSSKSLTRGTTLLPEICGEAVTGKKTGNENWREESFCSNR